MLYQSLGSNNETGIRAVLDNIDWTSETVDNFQQSILSSDVLRFCFSEGFVSYCLTICSIVAFQVHIFSHNYLYIMDSKMVV